MMTSRNSKFDINSIYVASPCPASWDAMHGDNRSRRCDQCELMVYNIEGLTTAETSALIAERTERICVKLRRRPDGTVITRDCPKGLAAYRKRLGVFAGAAVAAILGLFSPAFSQRPANDSRGIYSETSVEVPCIQGIVTDANGTVIPNATVTVVTSDKRTLSRKTDRRGRFQLVNSSLGIGRNRLTVSATGFNPFRDEFSLGRREMLDYPIMLEVGTVIGVVVISQPPSIDRRKSDITTKIRVNND